MIPSSNNLFHVTWGFGTDPNLIFCLKQAILAPFLLHLNSFYSFILGCSQPELCAYVNAHMCAYAHDQGRPLLPTSQKSNGSKNKKNEMEHLEQSLA